MATPINTIPKKPTIAMRIVIVFLGALVVVTLRTSSINGSNNFKIIAHTKFNLIQIQCQHILFKDMDILVLDLNSH